MNKKEKFIEKAIKIHGRKYDYSKVNYNTCKEKVCIICPEHGEFWQTPDNHTNAKQGCPKCGREKANINESLKIEGFIKQAKKVHDNKYDYSKIKYKNTQTKICIICPEHGEFWQTPGSHLSGNGCPKCKSEKQSKRQMMSTDEFINRAKQVHEDKYDYSEVTINGLHKKIKIFCKKCGLFFYQEGNSHLHGRGCPHCANRFLTTDKIVKMFKEIHGKKYDYSNVIYKTMKDKVHIICPKHGEFWQTPEKHLKGEGCPFCKESHLESEIRTLLENYNIRYEYDKSKPWLNKQRLDFYLPDYNVAIECQGIQHFKPSAFSSKINPKEYFIKTRNSDKLKLKKCKENNIIVLYYSDLKYRTFLGEKVFNKKKEFIEKILSFDKYLS